MQTTQSAATKKTEKNNNAVIALIVVVHLYLAMFTTLLAFSKRTETSINKSLTK